MPKRVDHQQRRDEIVDAMLALAVRDGIDAVSIRNVAAELGCTTGPVQYYFTNKAELLAAGHARVFQRQAKQIGEAVRRLGDGPAPRTVVETIVKSFLPTNRLSREAMVLYYNFYAVELTDRKMRIPNARDVPNRLTKVIAEQIRLHHGRRLPAGLDPETEASLLVAAIPSIASSVVAGYTRLATAKATLGHAIDRLLPVGGTT